jgi:hypothetical protein
MYNLVRAAESGWHGEVEGARDFELVWNGAEASSVIDASAKRSRPSRFGEASPIPSQLTS